MHPKIIKYPGLINYLEGIELMEDHLQEVINGGQDRIILIEHQPVYTGGTSKDEAELIGGVDIPVIHTNRGGKYTYHGPGQRVIYPIIDLRKEGRLRDIRNYINMLQEWIIMTLAKFQIKATKQPLKLNDTNVPLVGVWCQRNKQDAKIAAIGIRVRRWVCYHGIAVNINTNLDDYKGIIACGLRDYAVTSMQDLGVQISLEEFDAALINNMKKIF